MAEHTTYGAAFADVYDEWYGAADDLVLVTALLGEHLVWAPAESH
jgi:hypothetical protein